MASNVTNTAKPTHTSIITTIDGIMCLLEVSESPKSVRLKCSCFNFATDREDDTKSSWQRAAKGALNIMEKSPDVQVVRSFVIKAVCMIRIDGDENDDRQLLILTQHKTKKNVDKKARYISIISTVKISCDNENDSTSKVAMHMNRLYLFTVDNVIQSENIAVITDKCIIRFDQISNNIWVQNFDSKKNRADVTVKKMDKTFTRILVVYDCQNIYSVLGFCCENENCDKKELFMYQLHEENLGKITVKRIESSELCKIIPDEYVSIIESISVDDLQFQNESNEIKCASIFVVTSQKHLLHFVDGKLTRFIELPSLCDDMKDVQIHKYEGRHDDMVVVADGVSVIVLKGNQDFQIVHHENQVHKVIISDFIGRGTPQLLFIKDDPALTPVTCPPSDWVLTDLCGRYYDNDSREVKEDGSGEENMRSVTSALQTRLQHDQLVADDKRREITARLELIKAVTANLASLNIGGGCVVPDCTGLVTLCGDISATETNNDHITGETKQPKDSGIVVRKVWTSRVDDVSVIGVDVANLSDGAITNLSVTPVPIGQNGDSVTESHSSWPVSDYFTSIIDSDDEDWISKPSTSKKPRHDLIHTTESNILHPSRRTKVLCSLDSMNLLRTQEFNVFLYFDWIDDDKNGRVSIKFPSVKLCGRITVDVKDLIAPDDAMTPICRDFIYDKTTVIIKSSPIRVDLRKLVKNLGFESHYLTRDRYSLPKTMTSLNYCEIQLYADDMCKMTLLTRTKDDLCRLVRFLYHHLPDSAVIIPESETQTQDLINASITTLSHEIDAKYTHLQESLDRRKTDEIDFSKQTVWSKERYNRMRQSENERIEFSFKGDVCEFKTDVAVSDLCNKLL